jgi:hypothetical protein
MRSGALLFRSRSPVANWCSFVRTRSNTIGQLDAEIW